MRGLASRSVRPCLHHAPVGPVPVLPSIRRAILPRGRKGLTSADAFIILLPSVLTAAFVADIASKKERGHAWDRQIAAVEQENEALRQAQLEVWSRIQRRSVARGAWQQRRYMSSAAVAVSSYDEKNEIDPFKFDFELDHSTLESDPDPDISTATDIKVQYVNAREGSPEEAVTQARFERLIATRLALQLIAQIRASRTNTYNAPMPNSPASSQYNLSVDYLLSELEKITILVQNMKIENIPWGTMVPEPDRARKDELGQCVKDLSLRFTNHDIHLPEYILGFAALISEYKLGPPNSAYIEMMRAFSNYAKETAMAALVESTLWDGHQTLDSYAIAHVIRRHGTDADSLRFTEFLGRLSKKNGFPRSRKPWFHQHINDTRVIVPSSNNPNLIAELVRSALCCHQFHVAEAYAVLFIERFDDLQRSERGWAQHHIANSFLQSYAQSGSWRLGARWLHAAIVWSLDVWEAAPGLVSRIILRMLDFCVAHDRQEEYDLILDAAITSGIPMPVIMTSQNIRISQRSGQIRLDWIARAKHANRFSGLPPNRQNVSHFQDLILHHFQPDVVAPIQSPLHVPMPTSEHDDRSWHQTMSQAPVDDPDDTPFSSFLPGSRDMMPSHRESSSPTLHQREPFEHADSASGTQFVSPFFSPEKEPESTAMNEEPLLNT